MRGLSLVARCLMQCVPRLLKSIRRISSASVNSLETRRVPVPKPNSAQKRHAERPPKSVLEYLAWFEGELAGVGGVRLATVCGRYFTMDRDQRWERVSKGYAAIVEAKGVQANDARAAIENAYARGETDEFIEPTVLAGYRGMHDGDGVLMLNFRADRAREILSAIVEPKFDGFARAKIGRAHV
mgnify:CR=1 FL=1